MNLLIQNLIQVGAVKFGDFTLSSGLKSNYYVDLKRALCLPVYLYDVASRIRALAMKNNTISFKENWRWAGVELGAVPIAVACSLSSLTPYLIVRKTAKAHGTQSLVEGPFEPGYRVRLVEDVVTTGESSLKAISALQAAGLEVVEVFAVVDREQGGAERFKEAGVNFQALITASEILAEAAGGRAEAEKR